MTASSLQQESIRVLHSNKPVKTVSILDTSVCSSNLGDQIIMDSVNKILDGLFENALFIPIQTHDAISKKSHEFLNKSDLIFAGGTNLLSSNMGTIRNFRPWEVTLWDSFFIKDIILMGVGWWQYQKRPDLYTKVLYNRLLSKKYFHSVRDSYTEKQLNSIGITNVINTACPTMWSLTEEHCAKIPQKRSDSVLVTFTEYNQRKNVDVGLIELLKQEYREIYFWTQQPKDYNHMREIAGDDVIYLSPSLKALDQMLSNHQVDYIGTRLHAGIRALQHFRRSLILAVDNRASEISKDTNLPVISRDDFDGIRNWINSDYETKIRIPLDNINRWKAQFLEPMS
jgi:polysaccharide pyruvyl transferase WcaK-like protein